MIVIVLPVYNEELILEANVLKLLSFCDARLNDKFKIIISENGSTDKTKEIGEWLAESCEKIEYLSTQKRGKGEAVIQAWQNFKSDIYVYMDADLSTDLGALVSLIYGVQKGFDVAIGSRFIAESKVERGLFRKLFSFGLRFIMKILFNLKVEDTACGFKAVNQAVVDNILSKIENRTWFFDTEMLILSNKYGLKVKEIPVKWNEAERKSKVGIFSVIVDYLKNIFRLCIKK